MVRITDRPDMTSAFNHGRKATNQSIKIVLCKLKDGKFSSLFEKLELVSFGYSSSLYKYIIFHVDFFFISQLCSLAAPDTVKLTIEGDLSYFSQQDEVSTTPC